MKSERFLIIVSGFTGSGKSFVADIIREFTGCAVIRSDIIRKKMTGISLKEHVYVDFEKGIYSKEMTEKVYENMFKIAEALIKSSISVVIDASFLEKKFRDRARELSNKLKIDFLILWIEAPMELIKKRLLNRKDDISDGRIEILLKQIERYNLPQEEDVIFVFNSDKKEVIKFVKALLKQNNII
jgi:predicted kinase